MSGKLIFLFGIDGSGKSTILKMLEDSGLNNTIYTSCLRNRGRERKERGRKRERERERGRGRERER